MTADMSTDEMRALAAELRGNGFGEVYEALYAKFAGWKFEVFDDLYAAYIDSTQKDLKLGGNNTLAIKGNPLEQLGRYVLEKGGIAKTVKPGGLPNKWQVDGFGETYTDRLDLFFGHGGSKYGPTLYMEAKNHKAVMSNADWSQHCQRMSDHRCRFGVVFSTGGYAIGASKGYAAKLYHYFLEHTAHILLSICDLRRIAVDRIYPWSIVKSAFVRQSNQEYELASVQDLYATTACLELARNEATRLSAARSVIATAAPPKTAAAVPASTNK